MSRSPARVAVVVASVVGGLVAGLVLADLTTGDGDGTDVAAPPSTTPGEGGATPGSAGPTEPGSPTTAARAGTSSTTSPTTSSTVLVTSTLPSTTVAPTVPTTVATTAPPTTTPPLISISYLQDPAGALVLAPRGTATITLVNSGGAPGQWLLTPGSAELGLSAVQGTLGAGQSVTVVVTDLSGVARQSSIGGFVAPSRRVTIPVVVAS